MIIGFTDNATQDVFNGVESKKALKVPKSLWIVARRKLDLLNAAHDIQDLRVPPGNKLEKLKGNREGFHSIRINDQFRIVFKWAGGNAANVQIIDYH